MKSMKYSVLATAVALIAGFSSCKKDDSSSISTGTGGGNNNSPSIGAVPSTFTRKALVEEFTGAWCGYCPDGALILEEVIEANAGRAIGVSVHQSDGMEITSPAVWSGAQHNKYITTFTAPGFPAGMVNRVPYQGSVAMSRSDWENAANEELTKSAACGLAIESDYDTAGDSAKITVHAGFNQTISGDINLTVYLVEDSVTGTGTSYNQTNYYSYQSTQPAGGSGHPLYSLPYYITGYQHMHVLRKIITANTGDAITATDIVTGGKFVYKATVAIKSTYDKNNLKIVAFIHSKGTTATTHEVLNVQETKIGVLKNWD